MRVQCKPNTKYADLTPGNVYRVIGIEAGDLRIMNDEGRPYLYPRRLFQVIDPTEPDDWQTERGEDGERYAYPPPMNRPGFWEDYFNSHKDAIAAVRAYFESLHTRERPTRRRAAVG
jgi:hypothetical protein